MKRILMITVLGAAMALSGKALAQSQMSGPNGLAASPRLQKQLSERPVTTVVIPSTAVWAAPIVAGSPRIQNQLNERPKTVLAIPAPVVAGYQSRDASGIAASPKLQEQLNGQRPQFQIAPLK